MLSKIINVYNCRKCGKVSVSYGTDIILLCEDCLDKYYKRIKRQFIFPGVIRAEYQQDRDGKYALTYRLQDSLLEEPKESDIEIVRTEFPEVVKPVDMYNIFSFPPAEPEWNLFTDFHWYGEPHFTHNPWGTWRNPHDLPFPGYSSFLGFTITDEDHIPPLTKRKRRRIEKALSRLAKAVHKLSEILKNK